MCRFGKRDWSISTCSYSIQLLCSAGCVLQTTNEDRVLLHAPYGGKESRLGSWKALVEAQEAGQVRSIGVSNYGIHHLDELEEYINSTGSSKVDVGQYEIHPWCDRRNIIDWLKKRNIIVEAYSPLAHGTRFDEPFLRSLGKKYNKSPSQIMIRWVLQNVSIPFVRHSREQLVLTEYRASFLCRNQRPRRVSRRMLISLISSCRTMRSMSFIRESTLPRTGIQPLIMTRLSLPVIHLSNACKYFSPSNHKSSI